MDLDVPLRLVAITLVISCLSFHAIVRTKCYIIPAKDQHVNIVIVQMCRIKALHYRWGCLGVLWCIYILMAPSALGKHSISTVCGVFLPVLAIDTFCSLSVLKTLRKTPPGDRQMVQEKKKKKKGDGKKVEKRETHSTKSSRNEEKVKEKRSRTRGKGKMNSTKRKSFITIAIIQAVLTLNYLPIIITLPLDGLVPARALKCQYLAMALAAAASCSYLQPLLYLYRLGRLPCLTQRLYK